MNTLGRLFRVSMLGESHGDCVGIVVDGCPAGLALLEDDFRNDLDRRRSGAAGTTPRKEADHPVVHTGLFNGCTTGAPILIRMENRNVDSHQYETQRFTPRPGHADFTAARKYGGFNDFRGGGHFSGRLTAALVTAGVIAKKLIAPMSVQSEIVEIGGSRNFQKAVERALESKDSIGGIVSCIVSRVPVGLGEPFFDSVESLISHAIFAIPAIKGIEFGAGFQSAGMSGSECNDDIVDMDGRTETNHAGGINGGITNGNDLIFHVAVKPTSSIPQVQKTVDLRTGYPQEILVEGRHDACIALRMPVVVEAATAVVLADLMLLEQRIPRVLKPE